MKQHEGLKSNIQIQFLKRYVQVYSTISKELQRLYDSQPDNLTAQVLHSRSYNSRDKKNRAIYKFYYGSTSIHP